MQTLIVAGIGPGSIEHITNVVMESLSEADIIIGYKVYVDLLKNIFPQKEFISTPMKQEVERCKIALEKASYNKKVVFVCSGDSGIYGMSGLLLELAQNYPSVDIKILPGITAASSGSALLGAPLIHDFATISLSDYLIPWNKIEYRLLCAAKADFCIVLYNPSSHKRNDYLKKACSVLLQIIPKNRPCGLACNISRSGEFCCICTLDELQEKKIDMFTTVFIGNSETRIVNGKLITPRGYSF